MKLKLFVLIKSVTYTFNGLKIINSLNGPFAKCVAESEIKLKDESFVFSAIQRLSELPLSDVLLEFEISQHHAKIIRHEH